MYFKGIYEHTMDAKGRVFIPAKFREGLGDEFVLCKGFFDRCLYVFSNQEFEELSAKLDDLPFADEDALIIQRELYANACDVAVDKQGRVLVPAGLREYAQLTKDTVIVGVRTHVEIWQPELWKNSQGDAGSFRTAVRNLRAQGVKI